MTEEVWKQLNLPELTEYIELPEAFTGKGASGAAFAGLPLCCWLLLAVIHTESRRTGSATVKLTYEVFHKYTGYHSGAISTGLKILKDRGIISPTRRSGYKIEVEYSRNPYIEIDVYLFHHRIDGKRFAKTQILSTSFLTRGCRNPKTGGEFISSYNRIGKALNIPKSTICDSMRRLTYVDFVHIQSYDGDNPSLKYCSRYTVNPDVLSLKHPRKQDPPPKSPKPAGEEQFSQHDKKHKPSILEMWQAATDELEAIQKEYDNRSILRSSEAYRKSVSAQPDKSTAAPKNPEPSGSAERHAQYMQDSRYRDIIERKNKNYLSYIEASRQSKGEDTPETIKLEAEGEELLSKLDRYLNAHDDSRENYPPGFFNGHVG